MGELLGETDIPEKECNRALMSMIIGKPANRVLRKEPAGKELKKEDNITINDAFTSRLHKVKILTITKPGDADADADKIIKKRIEALIEREYLSRDTKDRNLYNYEA